MKGKRQFGSSEADYIRETLAAQPRTKSTRQKLRNIGFYISDFSDKSPFTVADFDHLIEAGEITISDSAAPSARIPSVSGKPVIGAIADRAEIARRQYRPSHITHLFVGESAPQGGTFFYFANSRLFRQIHCAFREVFGDVCRDETEFLRFFCARGFFLDDLCPLPVNGMDESDRQRERAAGIQPLAARLKAAMPQSVVVVMKAIAPEVRMACEVAGIRPKFIELPFPRPEHQAIFISGLVEFLRSIT